MTHSKATEKQKEMVLYLIRNGTAMLDGPPSMRWLADGLGVSLERMRDILRWLEQDGLIARRLSVSPRPVLTPRGLRLAPSGVGQ